MVSVGDKRACYLSFEAAGAELAPVLAAVGPRAFKPLSFRGLPELAEQDRATFFKVPACLPGA